MFDQQGLLYSSIFSGKKSSAPQFIHPGHFSHGYCKCVKAS